MNAVTVSRYKQDFIEDRNNDLLSVFRKLLLESNGYVTSAMIIEQIYYHPAQRFYISNEEAIRRAYHIIRCGRTLCKSNLRYQMYEEITRRALKLKSIEINRPLNKIIEDVIYQPAPMFYLTKDSIQTIISNLRNSK